MQPAAQPKDFLPLNGISHVELYVADMNAALRYYTQSMGFQWIASGAGYAPDNTYKESRVLKQGNIVFVLTSSHVPNGFVSEHVKLHGDGVRDIAFSVDDATAAYNETTKRGALSIREPEVMRDSNGNVTTASIGTYGKVIHSFVERKDYGGLFLPGYIPLVRPHTSATPVGLETIDHIVGNVELGNMNKWVKFYGDVMGFKLFWEAHNVGTKNSSLMSKVMSDSSEEIKLPINEPGLQGGQIQVYLDSNNGPGVQHIAMTTANIIATVRQLKAQGVEFITIPSTYYERVHDRVPEMKEDIKDLQELGILADKDPYGYLLQIFTKTVAYPGQDRPTLFLEIIQREGARDFGHNNFQALYEAIEEDFRRRGLQR